MKKNRDSFFYRLSYEEVNKENFKSLSSLSAEKIHNYCFKNGGGAKNIKKKSPFTKFFELRRIGNTFYRISRDEKNKENCKFLSLLSAEKIQS
jgi:hypothetical protein